MTHAVNLLILARALHQPDLPSPRFAGENLA